MACLGKVFFVQIYFNGYDGGLVPVFHLLSFFFITLMLLAGF